MSVFTQRKAIRSAGIIAACVLISGVAACDRSSETHADTQPAQAPEASAPVAPGADAPIGESTRSASLPDSSAAAPVQGGNSTSQTTNVQTADAALPGLVKAAAPVAAPDAENDAADKAPALSAEQQELAAEVGDTRHASAPASSDKSPD